MTLHHLAVLAAASPGHVSNLKYATESWTPGGTTLGVIILVVLIWAWMKIPSGPKVAVRRPAGTRDRAPARARVPERRRSPAR